MTFEPIRRWLLSTLVFCSEVACGGDNEPIPLLWVGNQQVPAPAAVSQNIFILDAAVNGTAKSRVIIDTGAPVSILDVDAFRGEVPAGSGSVSTVTVGRVTLVGVPTVGVSESAPALEGVPMGGLLGFTAFGQFSMSFNYRDRQVSFGSDSLPAEIAGPASVPFSLKGGGLGAISGSILVGVPPSRVLVPTEIEGERHVFMLDTGASVTGVRTSIFDQVTSDGRGTATDEVTLVTGSASTDFTRLRSVVVGGLEVSGAPALSGASIDTLLDSISAEAHESIDGFVGGSYLREFFVTIDYPGRTLVLRRYATRDHIHDEFQRVGIMLRGSGSPGSFQYFVRQVFPGTDAETQGIQVGDEILAVDGTTLAAADPVTVDTLFLGAVGTTHTLDLVGRSVVVRVDEILPLP